MKTSALGLLSEQRSEIISLAVVTFFCLMLYKMIGLSPFPGSALADLSEEELVYVKEQISTGNILNQVVWVFFTVICAYLIYKNANDSITLFSASVPLLLLVTYCVLSILWSPVPDVAFRRVVELVFTVIVAAGVAIGTPSARMLHRILFLATGIGMAVNILGVFLLPGLAKDADGNFTGLYTHKNLAGYWAMLSICIWLVELRFSRKFSERVLILIALCAWFLFLLGTVSKTSIALAIIAPFVLLFFQSFARRPEVFYIFLLSLAFLICATLYGFFVSGYTLVEILTLLTGDPTFTGRDLLWGVIFRAVSENPVLGVGFGSLWNTGGLNPIELFGTTYKSQFLLRANSAHNGYLDILATLGALGLTLFLIFLYTYIRHLLIAVQSNIDENGKPALQFCSYLLIISIPYNVTETSFFDNNILWFLLILCYFVLVRLTHPRLRVNF